MSAGTLVEIGDLVIRSADVCQGRPRISGTGVSVRRIVGWSKLGWSPDEIVARVGHLSLAQVYAALGYYHANRAELEADMAAEEVQADRLERQHYLAKHSR